MGVLKRSPLFMQKSGSISLKKGCEKWKLGGINMNINHGKVSKHVYEHKSSENNIFEALNCANRSKFLFEIFCYFVLINLTSELWFYAMESLLKVFWKYLWRIFGVLLVFHVKTKKWKMREVRVFFVWFFELIFVAADSFLCLLIYGIN
jgi:hypothetical protein